ncbi:MAG TPA: hypothetical protein VFE88_03280 [Candidatus Nanoarchaeia archaeon]|nr:hypothetical protein [Candidatus Nanoarchaeia archaeon]
MVHGGFWDEEKTALNFLHNPRFYETEVIPAFRRKTGKEFHVDEVVEVSTFEEGLFDSARLNKTVVRDAAKEEVLTFMIKAYYPLRGWSWENLKRYKDLRVLTAFQKRKIDKQWEQVKKDAESEREHMEAWNAAGVATPVFLAKVSKETSTFGEYGKTFGHKDMPLEVLVSTFVEGVTQDKDLLFLNQEIQRLNEGEHTLTIVRREDNPKKTVQQEIEFLEGKKRQAIMAMLYTASDLSLRVTALIDSDPEKFKHLKQRTHSYEALMDRLVRHARSYYVWCALGTPRSKVKLESVRKQKIPSAIKKKLNQLEKELRDNSNPVSPGVQRITDINRYRYGQRDEYPHNFIFSKGSIRLFGEGSRSVILDPDKAGLMPPELAKAMILGNNIAMLKPEEMFTWYLESVEQDRRIVAELQSERFLYRGQVRTDVEKNVSLFAEVLIYELLNRLGTNADNHIGGYHHSRFMEILTDERRGQRFQEYHNPALLGDAYDSVKVSTRPYEPKVANVFILEALQGVYELILENSKEYLKKEFSKDKKKELRDQMKFLKDKGLVQWR